jgi:hypothetical protein
MSKELPVDFAEVAKQLLVAARNLEEGRIKHYVAKELANIYGKVIQGHKISLEEKKFLDDKTPTGFF